MDFTDGATPQYKASVHFPNRLCTTLPSLDVTDPNTSCLLLDQ